MTEELTPEQKTENYYKAYFGKESSYYIKKLNKMKNGEFFVFNIYAFLFGLFWLLYRKMYLVAFIVFLIILASIYLIDPILESLINNNRTYNNLTNLIFGLLIGGFGNYFYFKKADKIISQAKQLYTTEDDILSYLETKGGTNLLATIIALIVFLIFIFYVFTNEPY